MALFEYIDIDAVISRLRTPHLLVISIAFTGIFASLMMLSVYAASASPLFASIDQFVLFADQTLSLDANTTISSGDIGANKTLNIGKDSTANGNLFADTIAIDKNTSINGNATFNKLTDTSAILGTKTTPISLPIAPLPVIAPFTIGTQDFTLSGTANTLPAGSYKDITVQKGSTLTLNGGTYNVNTLDLQEHATLIFTAPTTLNIQSKLRGRDHVSILNGSNAKPDDLHINYVGIKSKEDKGNQDDDAEMAQQIDPEDRADHDKGIIGRPVVFGDNAFLNAALLAPHASVIIGKDSTLRGQVLAGKIKAGKGFVGSRDAVFAKESDASKVIESGGAEFLSNEIIILMTDDATYTDAQRIADSVRGVIAGYIAPPQIYKIEVQTNTVVALDALINQINTAGDPHVQGATRNFILQAL